LTRYLTELLREQFGYTVASGKPDDNQMDFSQAVPQEEDGGANAPSRGLPQEERFKHAEVGGTFGLNQAIIELPMKRHDQDVPCEDVIKELWEISQRAYSQLADDDETKSKWDWHAQRAQIEKSVYGDINKRAHKHARLSVCLPNALRDQWDDVERKSGTPLLYQKRGMGRGAWAVIRAPGARLGLLSSPTMRRPIALGHT
jgi:hypothetical protein